MALMLVALTVPATSAGKGLAVTPETDKTSPAVIATKKVNQYFKDALGSSTLLIGKKAKKNTVLKQLKYNRKLIAWNYIGGGDNTSLFMYDGNLTSDDFNVSINKGWRGLKDCVCFVGSNESFRNPLRDSIINGSDADGHGVRTYIGCTVAVPIATHASVSEKFWNLTLLQCYPMDEALKEATTSGVSVSHVTGVIGYGIWGDTGPFFPPLDIKTIVSPGSCVVRQNKTMRITARSDRYVFPGATVVLNINDSSGDLDYSKTWHIAKKTKLLFKNHKWIASVDPGTYWIDIYVYSKGGRYCGEDHKLIAVAPRNGKLEFSDADAYERMRDNYGNATGWVKPTRCRTFKVEIWNAPDKETQGKPQANPSIYPKALTQVYQKTVPHKEKTWGEGEGEVYTEWRGILTGIYKVVIEYMDNNGRTRRDRYSGKCALNYTSPYDWQLLGGSGSHGIGLENYDGIISGNITDWTRAKLWYLGELI